MTIADTGFSSLSCVPHVQQLWLMLCSPVPQKYLLCRLHGSLREFFSYWVKWDIWVAKCSASLILNNQCIVQSLRCYKLMNVVYFNGFENIQSVNWLRDSWSILSIFMPLWKNNCYCDILKLHSFMKSFFFFADAGNILVQWAVTTARVTKKRIQRVGNKSSWRHGPRHLRFAFLLVFVAVTKHFIQDGESWVWWMSIIKENPWYDFKLQFT